MIVEAATTEGFTIVAEAREYILRLGQNEVKAALESSSSPFPSDIEAKSESTENEMLGCHVVAPVSL